MGTRLEIQHQGANTSSAALSHIMGCSSANLQQRERHTQSTHSGPAWKPSAWDAHCLPHAFKPSTGMQYRTRTLLPREVTGELDWQRNKVVKSWGSVFQPYSKVDTNTRYLHTCTYTHRQRHTGTHTQSHLALVSPMSIHSSWFPVVKIHSPSLFKRNLATRI